MTTTAPQIEDVLALSPLQEGLFALSRLAQDGVDPYTMQFVVDIEGPVDVQMLRRSAQAMLVRHPNLRAAFWDRDVPNPVQIVPVEAELPWLERSAMPTEFDAIARSERRRPFDLSRGPALRIAVLAVPGEARRRMIFTTHHILMDGWSLAVFFTEMLAVYRAGGSADALPTPRPYRDFIVWLANQNTAAAIAQWTDYLGSLSGPLMVGDGALSADAGMPEKTELLLAAGDTTRLRQWAASNGLTLNTAVLFAWIVVLGRLTDRRDVVTGTIVSGRPKQLAGVDSMVGLFINTVPVVHQLNNTGTVVEHCARLQRESSAMRDLGYLSLSELQRAHGGGTLFDTLFVFENAPIQDAIQSTSTPGEARFCPVEMESLTHYPLTVVSHMRDDELVVLVEAIRAALPHLRPEAMCERLLAVLRQLPDADDDSPDALDVLTSAERTRIADLATRPAPTADCTVWELFERQVRATPGALALSCGDGPRYSYAELHADAVRLATELSARGIGPETVVALVLPRSTRYLVAIFAVLAAGGAYVPVDTTLPHTRVESILRQANPALAITVTACSPQVAAGLPTLVLDDPAVAERLSRCRVVAPAVRRHPEHCAYVIFTSGSTGEPKGVIGTNAALVSYFTDHRERVYRPAVTRLGRRLRIAHAWSFNFDASWQPMAGLLDGHGLHLFDAEEMRDADRLVKAMVYHKIDMIDTTPSMGVQLCAAGLLDRPPAVLALGGEAIDTALWARLRALSATAVYNCYGPTETTVEAVVAPLTQYRTPTIGTANAGTLSYVLDSGLRPVPDGAVGELYLAGAQLARGYVGSSATTARRFVADPLRAGHRMYRTGDLVRRLRHGGYAYLGRADTQVKIRGYRVEVGEIEAVLRSQPGVDNAAVAVVRREAGASLVGLAVCGDNLGDDPVSLRATLTERLPAYMVPALIIAVPELPIDANGKLDGRTLERLAQKALGDQVTGGGPVSGCTGTEQALCEVFAGLLDGRAPGIDDDFFSLGIDSIVAISLVNRARRRGIAFSPRMVLTCPTIRQLAAAIDALASTDTAVEGTEYGEVLPLPMACWLFEYGNYRRFTHTVLLQMPTEIDCAAMVMMLQLVLDGHDTLRSILVDTPDGPRLVTREPGAVVAAGVLESVELSGSSDAELKTAIAYFARKAINEIDPHAGVMMRAVWLSGDEHPGVLLLTVHHLAVDVVSWHVMLGDIAEAWRCMQAGVPPKTLPEFTSYRRWSQLMWQRASAPQVQAQCAYWVAQVGDPDSALGMRHPDPTHDSWCTLRVTPVRTPAVVTERVLATLTRDEGVREFLLAVTTMTIGSWRRIHQQDPACGTLITVEGHGRADAIVDADTTNTVGWFTSAFPVRLGVGSAAVDIEQAEQDPQAARALLDSVAADLRAMPYDGLDYGLLRYVSRTPQLQAAAEPQIQFSYLGRWDHSGVTHQPWSPPGDAHIEALPLDPEPDLPLRFALNISGFIGATPQGAQLVANWRWSSALFTESDIDHLTGLWQRGVAALAAALDDAGPC